MNKRLIVTIAVVASAVALGACSKKQPAPGQAAAPGQPNARQTAPSATAALPHLTYIAHLSPLNTNVTKTQLSGTAQFGLNNGMLTIRVSVTGAAPDIAHAQHIHGFVNGNASSCPTSAADTDGNGILSLSEADKVMGPPLIPLNADPLALDFTSLTYPTANANGSYTYQETVSLNALKAAFSKAHNGQKLDLTKDSVMIHGVPVGTRPPAAASAAATAAGTLAAADTAASAASAAGTAATPGTKSVPASIQMPAALPIACGKITPAGQSH